MMHPPTRFVRSRVRNDAPLVRLQCPQMQTVGHPYKKSQHADREVLTRK